MTVLKSLVYMLVLANAGYFLWAQGIGRTQAVPVAPAAAQPGTLQLASEVPALRPAASEPAVPATSPVSSEDTQLIGNVKRCVSVGPFRDVSETAHAASTLRAGGYDPRQRVVEGEVYAGVWVYVPIVQGHAVTEQILAKLKGAGIDDALEMPGPAEGSVISLGLFNEQKRALARVAQAQTLGLSPAMTDRKRSGNVYWVDIDLKPKDGMLNPADLQGEAGRIQRLEVKACPAAAA